MNRKDSAELYMHKLKKNLILPKECRQSFIEGLTQEIREYTNEHTSCTYEHLIETFGEPGYVARQFIEQSDSTELERHTKRRRMVFCVMMAVLVALVVFLAVLVSIMMRHKEVRVTEKITESSRQNEYASFTKEY